MSDSITCPKCGRESWNQNDVQNRYCGYCHQYHDDMGITLAMAQQRPKKMKTAEEILIQFIAETRVHLMIKKRSCENKLEVKVCMMSGAATKELIDAIGMAAAGQRIDAAVKRISDEVTGLCKSTAGNVKKH